MDFGGLLFIGLIWLLFNLLGRSRQERAKAPPRPRPAPPGGGDATQQEGSKLERLLRELERAMDQASAGPTGRPTPAPAPAGRLPSAEEVEEREVLEVGPRVESLEVEVRRPTRATVDQDEQADQVIARRAAAAAARSGAHTRADHQRFDERIRQQPAEHTAVRPLTPQQLRDAVVWRELLGPPVSLRDD